MATKKKLPVKAHGGPGRPYLIRSLNEELWMRMGGLAEFKQVRRANLHNEAMEKLLKEYGWDGPLTKEQQAFVDYARSKGGSRKS